MHVLIATDGSDDAIRAGATSLSLLQSPDHVTVVLVADVPAAATAGYESGFSGGVASPEAVDAAWDATNDHAAADLQRTVDALPIAAEVTTRIEYGSPGATICRIAEEVGADVVVVGTRGRGAIARALLGSVSAHVATHAPCPVLVGRA
jgi:nucleotide-binding universal stress UspA family protein